MKRCYAMSTLLSDLISEICKSHNRFPPPSSVLSVILLLMATSTPKVHRLEDVEDSSEPSAKRVKVDAPAPSSTEQGSILPASYLLLGIGSPPVSSADSPLQLRECDVGITEYVGKHVPSFQGIIKQRYLPILSIDCVN